MLFADAAIKAPLLNLVTCLAQDDPASFKLSKEAQIRQFCFFPAEGF